MEFRRGRGVSPLFALLAAPLFAQQQPGALQRDLKIERLASPAEMKKTVVVPRGYAVVIGVSKYKNLTPKDQLVFPESDAEKVAGVLLSKQAGNMEFENVRKLIGPQATLANIRDALENWLPSRAKEGDRVIVYFVGHGAFDDSTRRGYLLPYDVDPQRFAETGYAADRLGQVLSQVKSRWKVLLLDACHSGSISGSVNFAGAPDKVNESLRGLPQTFLTLTSSRTSEASFEDPNLAGGNGLFSYFLERGWMGEADVDPGDGIVSADELITYVKREVKAYARQRGFQQTPLEFGDFPDDLLLGYSSDRRAKIASSMPELANGAVVVEVNLDNVEVYVDDQRYGTASPSSALPIPGLASGTHKIRGVRMGYEPVVTEVNVAPGTRQTVTLRLLHQRVVKPAAQALYDEGEGIWRRSGASPADMVRAADRFTKALKEDPAFSPASLGLCRVQQAQAKPDAALKSCAKAIELDADYLEAREAYAAVLMETGDYPEAVRQLQQGAIAAPKDTFVHSMLAEALYLADRPQEAEQEADKAIALDDASAQGYLLRGEARRAQKRFTEAAADYHRALDLEEYGSGRLRVAAFFIIGTGMTKHRSGRRALYRSHAASAWFGLCSCEMERENYLQAVKDCKKALSIEADDPDSYFVLGEVYARLFNTDNSREYLVGSRDAFDAVLKLNPNYERAPDVRKKLREINGLLATIR